MLPILVVVCMYIVCPFIYEVIRYALARRRGLVVHRMSSRRAMDREIESRQGIGS
jgi:hypothetical protein